MRSGAGLLLRWAVTPWLWRSPRHCRFACKAAPDRSRTWFRIVGRKLPETMRWGDQGGTTWREIPLLARSGGKPEIVVPPDASPTWFERPGGGQVLTEALMRMNQQTQLSCDRL